MRLQTRPAAALGRLTLVLALLAPLAGAPRGGAAERRDASRRAVAPPRPSHADTALAVVLLETTDLHGALLPGGKERSTGRAWGGSAVVAAWQRRLSARVPQRTFLFDGGDMMQGSPISNLVRGRSVIDVMNAEGYDAAALGNHEFDWGIDTLRARIREAAFPVLAANVFEKATGQRPSWLQPTVLVKRGQVTVGVIGAATPETPLVTLPENVVSLRFDDPAPILTSLARDLRTQGADVVVALLHIGGDPPRGDSLSGMVYDVARRTEGVDVFLGGHTHTFVSATVAGHPVLVAGSHGRAVAEVDLVVNPLRHIARVVGQELHRTYADSVSVATDDVIAAIVARHDALVGPIMSRVIANTPAPLRRTDPGLGNLVSDVMRVALHADVSLTNAGGLRRDLDAGPISLGTAYELLPFENTLVTLKLTGAELRQTLEEQASRVRFSGVRARYDATRPVGQRVVDVVLASGVPLDSTATYTVVTNDFMAQGGDGFTTLALAGERPGARLDTGRLVRDAVIAWMETETAAGRPIAPDPNERFAARPPREER